MDISKQNGNKKQLPIMFYCFLTVAVVHVLVLVYSFMSNVIFEWRITIEYLLLCTVLFIPLQWVIMLIAIISYLITNKQVYRFFYIIFLNIALTVLTITLLFNPTRDWSDKKKHFFLEQCYETGVVRSLGIDYVGFSQSEIEKIFVQQIRNGEIIDTFYIKTSKKDSISYYSTISPFMICDTYHFIISEQSFTLSNIKLRLAPRFTMTNINYECVVDGYKLNDSIFNGTASNLVIINNNRN